MKIKATTVFNRNWKASQEVTDSPEGKKVNLWKIILNEGGSRSSKTWSLFQLIFLWCLNYVRIRVVVLRETAVDCRDVVESEFKDWIADPRGRAKEYEEGKITVEELQVYLEAENLEHYFWYKASKHEYIFKKTGSSIIFGGADNLQKVMGKGTDIVWVNEPYKFPEEVMNQLLQRIKRFLLLDWNPKETHYIEGYKKRDNCKVIHSTFRNNPFCPEASKQHILSYLPLKNKYIEVPILNVHRYIDLPLEQLESKLDELGVKDHIRKDCVRAWNNHREGTASDYHWEVYGEGRKAERPNRIFNWQEIPDSTYHGLDVPELTGIDWGISDPFAIGTAKYYDGALYVHEKHYKSENQVRKELSPTELLQVGSGDEALVLWIFKQLGIDPGNYGVCDNNRQLKHAAIRRAGWGKIVATRKYKGSILDGINLLLNLKVYYTASSKNIAYEQENYSRKLSRLGEVLEDPVDTDNHHIDWIRYIAQWLKEEGIIKLKTSAAAN